MNLNFALLIQRGLLDFYWFRTILSVVFYVVSCSVDLVLVLRSVSPVQLVLLSLYRKLVWVQDWLIFVSELDLLAFS